MTCFDILRGRERDESEEEDGGGEVHDRQEQ